MRIHHQNEKLWFLCDWNPQTLFLRIPSSVFENTFFCFHRMYILSLVSAKIVVHSRQFHTMVTFYLQPKNERHTKIKDLYSIPYVVITHNDRMTGISEVTSYETSKNKIEWLILWVSNFMIARIINLFFITTQFIRLTI